MRWAANGAENDRITGRIFRYILVTFHCSSGLAWRGGRRQRIKEKEKGGDFSPEDESDMGTAEEERARMLEDVLRDEAMLFDKMAWKLFEGRIASLKEDSAAAEEAKATVEDSGQEKVGKEEENLQVTSGEKAVLARNEKEQNKGGALSESKDNELDFIFLLATRTAGRFLLYSLL